MFGIMYSTNTYHQWADNNVFDSYQDAVDYLIENNFKRTKNGLEKDFNGWYPNTLAFISPRKRYVSKK